MSMELSTEDLINFIGENQSNPDFERMLREKFPDRTDKQIVEYLNRKQLEASLNAVARSFESSKQKHKNEEMSNSIKSLISTLLVHGDDLRPLVNMVADMFYDRIQERKEKSS